MTIEGLPLVYELPEDKQLCVICEDGMAELKKLDDSTFLYECPTCLSEYADAAVVKLNKLIHQAHTKVIS